MSDRLISADVRTDAAEIEVVDAIGERLDEHGHDYRSVAISAVVNEKVGEPDEDPRTYFVQTLLVSDDGIAEPVRTCTCKGFKYHSCPEMGAFEDVEGDELKAALQEVGECKHIERVRTGERSIETRGENQVGLDELLGY